MIKKKEKEEKGLNFMYEVLEEKVKEALRKAL